MLDQKFFLYFNPCNNINHDNNIFAKKKRWQGFFSGIGKYLTLVVDEVCSLGFFIPKTLQGVLEP